MPNPPLEGQSFQSRSGTRWTIVKRWTDVHGNIQHRITSEAGAVRIVYEYELNHMKPVSR
jgi:hypothetical protein